MNDQSIASSLRTFPPATTAKPVVRPMAARTTLLLEGPILPTLLRLAAPNVLNLLAIAGMITFDGLFLGRLGPDVLAGVSLAFPFVMLIQHTAASGMGGGVSSAIARALGAGKRDVADALALHAFVLALGLAAAFSAVLLLGAPFVFRWMGGHGEMLSAALAYGRVAFSGAVSICMLNLLGNAVRGTGNMSLPAAVIVGSCDRARPHFADTDFRMGAVAGIGSGGRRMGPDRTVRRRQHRAARLPPLAALTGHPVVSRLAPAMAPFCGNSQGRRAGIAQYDDHESVRRAVDRDRGTPRAGRRRSATRWARASNTSSFRSRSDLGLRSSPWSAPTGAPESTIAHTGSCGRAASPSAGVRRRWIGRRAIPAPVDGPVH